MSITDAISTPDLKICVLSKPNIHKYCISPQAIHNYCESSQMKPIMLHTWEKCQTYCGHIFSKKKVEQSKEIIRSNPERPVKQIRTPINLNTENPVKKEYKQSKSRATS